MEASPFVEKHYGRILIRKREGDLYLQPSGEWSEERQTARAFIGSVAAYYWAKEQELLGVEVLMAFADERYDIVTFRI